MEKKLIKSQLNELNVPKLRFKGFAKEWRSENLINMAEFIQGITYNKENEDINGKYFVLRANNIYNSNLLLENLIKINVNVKNNKYFIQENDVLICTNSGSKNLLGKSCIINSIFKNYLIGGFMMVARNYEPIIPYLLTTRKWFNEITLDDTSTIYSISKSKLSRIKFFIPNNDEQQKIAEFFVILDKQIKLWERKLQLNELKQKFYENKIYRKFIFQNEFFSKVFKEYNEKNSGGLSQYTIGKNGMKMLENINYEIYDHKKINKMSLIIGLGVEEIIFNKSIEGCCSPIYNTYHLDKNFYFLENYFDIYIKKYFISKRMIITKISTRRDWEIDKSEIKNMYIDIPSNYNMVNIMVIIRQNIKYIIQCKKLYISKKQYYLNKLFI